MTLRNRVQKLEGACAPGAQEMPEIIFLASAPVQLTPDGQSVIPRKPGDDGGAECSGALFVNGPSISREDDETEDAFIARAERINAERKAAKANEQ